jgi:hypothetical protein
MVPATRVFIAPDLDLSGLPIEGAFWKALTGVLRYVRIPFPALEVHPRWKVWGLR